MRSYLVLQAFAFFIFVSGNVISDNRSLTTGWKSEDETFVRQAQSWLNETCRLESLRGSGGWRLVCEIVDTLETVPTLPRQISLKIYSLVIRNQPRFYRLNQDDVAKYPSLMELILNNNGLTWIEHKAFTWNKYLQKIDLSSNALRSLDWRSMVNLREASLDLSDNRLICNCSIFWLVSWRSDLAKRRRFAAPDGKEFFVSTTDAMTLPKEILHLDTLRCTLEESETRLHLNSWRFVNAEADFCSLPKTSIEPKLINTREKSVDSMVQFRCTIESRQAIDLEFRQPFQLKVVDPNETRSRSLVETRISQSGATLNLRLTYVTGGQTGWYVCLGLSVSGPNFDMAALVVESKPTTRLLTRNRTKSMDHFKDTFEFMIFAAPPPSNYSWFKNGISINFSDPAHKHAFTIIEDQSERLRGRGFFYAFRLTFIVKFRYARSFFEGDYSLKTCNAFGCDRLTFVVYDKNSLPEGGPDRVLSEDGLSGRIGVPQGEQRIEPETSEPGWIVAVSCMSLGLLMCGSGIVFHYLRKKRREVEARVSNRRSWRQDRDANNGVNVSGLVREGASVQLSSYTSNAVYEPLLSTAVPLVPKGMLEIVRPLGEGAFGQVYLAYCKLEASPVKRRSPETTRTSSQEKNDDERSLVAAKTLKQFTIDRSQELAHEAELMAKLNHPNIVTFYGVCLRGGDDLLLLYEYMELGDLRKFLTVHGPHPELSDEPLRDNWRLSSIQLIDITRQVARGLAYLHEHHFVHRDLACRNCLVKGPLVVKLSDFGMTRDIYSSDYYRLTHKAPLPVRWLPPESLLYGRFSNLSDIWGYGVVIWEIATFGQLPWGEYSNVEVMQRVNSGQILTPPPACPPVLQQLMIDCWQRTPSDRVKLEEIVLRLDNVLQNA